MRFVCLCYYTQAQIDSWTPADHEKVRAICAPRDAELRATGRLVLDGALGDPASARTLRAEKGGDCKVTEGPYATSKEPLGAIFVIEAADLDEAVTIACLHPGVLREHFGGGIEVRPYGVVP